MNILFLLALALPLSDGSRVILWDPLRGDFSSPDLQEAWTSSPLYHFFFPGSDSPPAVSPAPAPSGSSSGSPPEIQTPSPPASNATSSSSPPPLLSTSSSSTDFSPPFPDLSPAPPSPTSSSSSSSSSSSEAPPPPLPSISSPPPPPPPSSSPSPSPSPPPRPPPSPPPPPSPSPFPPPSPPPSPSPPPAPHHEHVSTPPAHVSPSPSPATVTTTTTTTDAAPPPHKPHSSPAAHPSPRKPHPSPAARPSPSPAEPRAVVPPSSPPAGHVLVLAPSPPPVPPPGGDIPTFISLHNTFRAAHHTPPLTWSAELASGAQTFANGCQFRHSGAPNLGENLYTISASTNAPSAAVNAWYDEIALYNFSKPAFSLATGHATQVLWVASKQLGCGVASGCASPLAVSGTSLNILVVCRYSPPGNVEGAFAKNVLAQHT